MSEIQHANASHSEAATEEPISEQLCAFETGALDLGKFPHSDHVRMGYEMLSRYSFGEAIDRFSRGLKLLAARAGRPQVYHETITVAFLALINERRARDVGRDWKHFRDNNVDLLDKLCLENWYSREQLASGLARRVFCLPSRSGDLKSPT
jgi:hypothetical protein